MNYLQQTHRGRKQNGGCHASVGGGENGELLLNGYIVSATQGEKVLEICYITMVYTVSIMCTFVKRVEFMLYVLYNNNKKNQ